MSIDAKKLRELIEESNEQKNPIRLDLYLRFNALEIADLADEVERLRKAGEHFVYAMDSFRSGGMKVEGVQAAEQAFRTALAKPANGGGE